MGGGADMLVLQYILEKDHELRPSSVDALTCVPLYFLFGRGHVLESSGGFNRRPTFFSSF